MKKHKKNIVITIIILSIIIGISVCLFFRYGDQSKLLSALGSYISGIIGILNLLVFVYLTSLISKEGIDRSEKEIRVQKIITQTQFRQAEIEKLINEFEKQSDFQKVNGSKDMIEKITKLSIVLNNFFNQKQYLFPILQKEDSLNLVKELSKLYVQKIKILLKEDLKQKEDLSTIFIIIQEKQNDFIHLLQSFTIGQLR